MQDDQPPIDVTAAVAPQHPPTAPEPLAQTNAAGSPRIWPTLVVVFCVVPVFLITSTGVTLLLLIVASNADTAVLVDPVRVQALLNEIAVSISGVVFLFLPHLLIIGGAAVIPAILSSVPARQRLGLVRGKLPLWTWPILMLSVPFTGMIMYLIFPALGEEPGDSMRFVVTMVQGASGVGFAVVLIIVAFQAGIFEELLFRGYVQTRLMRVWPAVWAIALPSAIFAIMHMDWRHILVLIPMAAWFGIVAWRVGSVWPTIIGHCFNNAYSVIAIRMTDPADIYTVHWDGPAMTRFIIFGAAFVISVIILVRGSASPDEVQEPGR